VHLRGGPWDGERQLPDRRIFLRRSTLGVIDAGRRLLHLYDHVGDQVAPDTGARQLVFRYLGTFACDPSAVAEGDPA
jgi:hypothetical protein